MNSPFIVNNTPLALVRFPVTQSNRSLQAWDAADELMIDYLHKNNLVGPNVRILIVNDSFGALALNFCQQTNPIKTFSVSDSYISHQGLQYNLQQNALTADTLTLLTSLAPLPADINLVLYKIPKSNSLLIEQLIQIKHTCADNTLFIAAARAKDIHSSTLKLFEKHLGTTSTSLATKKARLVFSKLDNSTHYNSPFPNSWPLEKTAFTLLNHANVFAREQLDLGARFFLQYLPTVAADAQVIDLGCGNGVIGLSLLANNPQINMQFIDESYMAIASAQANINANLPQYSQQCQFKANDCLTGVANDSVDLILCNPPFHQQQAVTDHIAWQMFTDSYRVLKKGGELRIIGNRQLGYHVKLKRLFSECHLIASNQKFVIISVKK